MKKRIISFALVLVILVSSFGGMFAASAALPEGEGTVQPMYKYINMTSVGLHIDGTTATCTSSIDCYSGTTKIKTTLTLQKKKNLFSWEDVESWSQIVLAEETSFVKSRTGLASGSYRVKVVFLVYQGTNTETVTDYSLTRTV